VRRLVASLQQSRISSSAYDTAFVARLRKPGNPQALAFPQSLNWLLRNQNRDGSFGTSLPVPKERLLSTMGALVCLANLPQAFQDGAAHRARLQALNYIYEGTANWQTGVDTAGFEVVLPALLEEARAHELPLPYERFLGVAAQRDAKIGHIPPGLIYNVATPLLYSLEYLNGRLNVEAARKRISANGSFGNSPSATAFFLSRGEDERAAAYISGLASSRPDGGIPTFAPFEVYEIAWVLYNLSLADYRPKEAQPHLAYLARALGEDGVGISKDGLRPDADDTALTLSVLHRYGYPISSQPLRSFEGINFYLTFPLERDASVSTNAHVLEVLSTCPPFPRQHLIRQKVIRFLCDARVEGGYWVDKWHSSPFYATAHALFALTAPAPDACRPALRWLQETQRPDGSWGWFGAGTAEETAYAVQAWMTAPEKLKEGLHVDLDRAEAFLNESAEQPPIPMWVAKTLFVPTAVVESAILSARILLMRRAAC
jgi:halimadienyl-diphosphate synthase